MNRSALSSRLVALAIALVLVVLALGISRLLGEVVSGLLRMYSLDPSTTVRLVLGVVVQQGIVFCGLAALYLWIRGLDLDWVGVSMLDFEQVRWIAGGWIAAFTTVFVFGIVIVLAGFNAGENRLVRIVADNPEALLVMIPVTIVLIGPGEELLFRGIVQGSLRERFGPVIAIVLASAIFAAAHVTSLTGPLESRMITVALLFVPTLVFAISYERTGNVLVPMLIHGLYNATLFSLQYAVIKLSGMPVVL
jgi:membrane protease YdiL (CAAX protease family)